MTLRKKTEVIKAADFNKTKGKPAKKEKEADSSDLSESEELEALGCLTINKGAVYAAYNEEWMGKVYHVLQLPNGHYYKVKVERYHPEEHTRKKPKK